LNDEVTPRRVEYNTLNIVIFKLETLEPVESLAKIEVRQFDLQTLDLNGFITYTPDDAAVDF
jgi:hypothetical protein